MKKILIVDDVERNLDTYSQTLFVEGFNVVTASNGIDEGIELFYKECFDLVIINLNMPGLNGLNVLENIKDTIPEIPVILALDRKYMSENYLLIDTVEAKKLGVNAVISKTIDDGDFCDVVRLCLEDKVYTSKIFCVYIETETQSHQFLS